MPDSPARRAALLRLLEDWEAKRKTPIDAINHNVAGHLLWGPEMRMSGRGYVPTDAGLAAARAIKEAQRDE